MLRDFSRRLLDATGGTGGADGGAAAAAAAAAAAGAAKPWYEGKLDAGLVGHAQNAGWKLDDPATLAIEAVKAHREARSFIGVPESRILKLPEKTDDDAGWAQVFQRLGAPADAKDYDFSTVKHADGSAPDAKLVDVARAAAAALRAPKDKAPEIAKAVVKLLDDQKAEQTAVATAKITEEKAALARSWGTKADENMLTAKIGAKRLGVDPETVALLEQQVGYSKVMEMFRKIGAGTAEDTFVQGGSGSGSTATREGAQARLNELMADPAWGKRLTAGDAAAVREFNALTTQIAA